MDDLKSHWQRVISAFNHRVPVPPAEVASLYLERPQAPSQVVLGDLELDDDTVTYVLCGSRGSGKSTELSRIYSALDSRFLAIRVDFSDALPKPLSTAGLLLLLGLAVLHSLERWKVADEVLQLGRAAFGRGLDSLGLQARGELDVGKLVEGAAGVVATAAPGPDSKALVPGAGVIARATRLGWPREVGEVTRGASDSQRASLLAAVNELLALLTRSLGRRACFLAEGLDKLTRIDEVMQALQQPRLLADLQAPMVLTGPINLMHNAEFSALRHALRPLPLLNLAVRDPSHPDLREGPGVESLLQVFELRQVHHGLPADVASAQLLRTLARFSAGSVRDFVDLVRRSASRAFRAKRRALAADDVEEAIRQFRQLMQFSLHERSIEQLRQVKRRMRPTGDPLCEELLFENYILCYTNGDLWYRPHECLVDWIRE